MSMALSGTMRRRVASLSLAALGLAAAVLLTRQSISANLERACSVNDTPYLNLCPKPASRAQRVADLRSRIAANPGDSKAYVHLAFADRSADGDRLLAAAARLAPTNANVTAMIAAQALENQDWPSAIAPLIDLVEYGHNDKAALMLARLVASGRWQLLAHRVTAGSHWLTPMLGQMPNVKGPFSAALPLVTLALDRGVLSPAELVPYVRQLKSAGAWGDAYSLWVALHQRTVTTLYNGDFDQPFEEDGFDWEVTAQHPISRSGALIERARDSTRGALLDIRFTGRPIAMPLVRQNLFIGPGRYRLRGDYKAAQLRMEQGLAWTLRCPLAPHAQTIRSPALGDTNNVWRPFEFVFSVAPGCGSVASLQLETFAPFEATVGSRGRAAFDALSLEPLQP
jgi:hypothetical protein